MKMEILDINPFVRYAGIADRPELCSKGVIAYDCRLFYIQEGSGTVNIAGSQFKYTNNTLLLVREGIYYQFEFPKKHQRMIIINFDLDMSNKDLLTPITPDFPADFDRERLYISPDAHFFSDVCIAENASVFKEMLFEIVDGYVTQSQMFREKASALLKGVLTDIFCKKQKNEDKFPQLVKDICDIARQSYFEHIDIAMLEKKFGYNAQYLNRKFKEYIGIGFHQYLVGVRIDEAKKYLVKTELSSESIAQICGFVNTSHFCASFKKSTGQTPGEYRKSSKLIVG